MEQPVLRVPVSSHLGQTGGMGSDTCFCQQACVLRNETKLRRTGVVLLAFNVFKVAI